LRHEEAQREIHGTVAEICLRAEKQFVPVADIFAGPWVAGPDDLTARDGNSCRGKKHRKFCALKN
jgi:hypothetical protein